MKKTPRGEPNKSLKKDAVGAKTAPKIDPGGFFLASGGALARQEAARRL